VSERKERVVWRGDCYIESASDVPAAGNIRPAQNQSRFRHAPPKRAALKNGRVGWENPLRHGGNTPPASILWEASDQRRRAKRHPALGGVSCFIPFPWVGPRFQEVTGGSGWLRSCTCLTPTFAVLFDLPVQRLMRATLVEVQLRRSNKENRLFQLAKISCGRSTIPKGRHHLRVGAGPLFVPDSCKPQFVDQRVPCAGRTISRVQPPRNGEPVEQQETRRTGVKVAAADRDGLRIPYIGQGARRMKRAVPARRRPGKTRAVLPAGFEPTADRLDVSRLYGSTARPDRAG